MSNFCMSNAVGVNGIADHGNKDFSAMGLHFKVKGANVHDQKGFCLC